MITVTGSELLNANLAELEKNIGRLSKSAFIAGGKLVESDAKISIQSKSEGHMVTRYRNGGSGYDHLASNEGKAPNSDTGALANSIQTEIESEGVYVGTTIEYGKFLEFGTSEMGERPWLMPALDGRRVDIVNLQVDAVNASIKKASVNV